MRRHLVAAMSVLGLSLAWGTPALAQTITVTSLLQQDQYVAGVDGATFELTLTVSDTLPDDARIAVTSYKRISTRQLVRDAVAGKLASPIDSALIEVTADDFVEGNTISITVPIETVSRTKDALQLSASGIYPLAIGVQQDKTISTAIVTFIERLPDNQSEPSVSENLNLAVVGSVDGAITLQPDGSSVIDDASRAAVGNALQILEASPPLPVAVALKPEIIESLGQSTPDDAGLVDSLNASTSLELLSTPYVDFDPSEATATELGNAFTDQLRLGEDTLLTALLGQNIDRGVFFVRDELDAGGAQLLRDLGFRTLLLSHNSQKATGNGISLMADSTRKIEFSFGAGATVDVMLAEPNLSTAVSRGSLSPNPYLVAQQIVAELKLLRSDLLSRGETLSGRTVVLSTDDGSLPSVGLINALVSSLASQPDIGFVTLGEAVAETSVSLVDGRPVTAELPVSDATVDSGLARQIVDVTSRINGFASMLPDDDLRPDRWRRLLHVLPDQSLDETTRQTYVDVVTDETSAIAATVSPPASTTFTLGGRDSSIRLTLRNDSDVALSVLVRLSSSKLTFPEGEKTVMLPSGTTTAVEIPVTARSNGRFPVSLTLLTPDGSQTLGSTATFTARVNALAGLGQLVTGIGLLLLISWWAHHLRKQRRLRHVEAGDSAGRHPAGERN